MYNSVLGDIALLHVYYTDISGLEETVQYSNMGDIALIYWTHLAVQGTVQYSIGKHCSKIMYTSGCTGNCTI
jgi:hypothetical protein